MKYQIKGKMYDAIPENYRPANRDILFTEDYRYIYEEVFGGWNVHVIDTTKTEYEPILSEFAGVPIIALNSTFIDCENLIKAPLLPDTVKTMRFTFARCYKLKEVSNLPSSLEKMVSTFANCIALEKIVDIPKGTKNISNIFENCKGLIENLDIKIKTAIIIKNIV